jgi:hypothetical protein
MWYTVNDFINDNIMKQFMDMILLKLLDNYVDAQYTITIDDDENIYVIFKFLNNYDVATFKRILGKTMFVRYRNKTYKFMLMN